MKKEVFEEIIQIIKKQKLNINLNQNKEKTVKEFKDKVDWNYISKCQTLSESFIKEFQDNVNWYWISYYQNLSESFMKKFKDKINWNYINQNKKIIKTKKFQELINKELLIQELKQ